MRQNPDFFASEEAIAKAKTAQKARTDKARPPAGAKLSYKDQRRLEELAGLIETLPAAILRHEKALADPGLYGRDRPAFDRLSTTLDKARAELASAEDEWLSLEERREALRG